MLVRALAIMWTHESDQVSAELGWSLSSAGDVNGDGYVDIIVGAPYYDDGETNEGQASVYYGASSGFGATPGWTAEGNEDDAELGYSVAGGRDVNGDGLADVLVTSRHEFPSQTSGMASVFHGSAAGLDTSAAWITEGEQADDHYAFSGAFAGDVDGDGFHDVVVGSPRYDGGEHQEEQEGRSYLYHGSVLGLSTIAAWIAESNQEDSWFGQDVASAGDVDGDGFDDVIVSAPLFDNGQTDEGRVSVYLGSPSGLGSEATWFAESNQENPYFGGSVASAGDVNADGFDDVIVGSPSFDNVEVEEGGAFLFLGSAAGLDPVPAWTIESNSDSAYMGIGVGSAGDLNSDGHADVIVGSANWDAVVLDEGGAFVFLGTATGLETTAEFIVDSGERHSWFGFAVATAGDVDGDGYDDILVGAPFFENGQGAEGRAFLFAGTCADPNDTDGDDVGDLCELCPGFDDRLDTDIDGLADGCDVCPSLYDPMQEDDDADGIGDACDLCPANSPDADDDGFCAPQDCDDNNPAVYPGAYEACDGVDNACSGTINPDELDEDGDGEPICAGDCDDANAAVFTGQAETCNGLDDNCDGDLSPDELDADEDHITVCGGDCDDNDDRASPDLFDICGDAIDNDCDGEVDQNCGANEETDGTGCTCNGTGGAAGAQLLALALLLRTARRRGG